MFDCEEAIDALVEAAGVDGPPVWAVFDRADGAVEGFTLRQDTDRLLGWRAPAGSWAIGMVSGGTAHIREGHGTRSQRCRLACVVDRWDGAAGLVHLADGGRVTEAPEAGRMFDTLARCLGRRTPRPDHGPALTLALVWLGTLAVEHLVTGRRLGWPEAIALHPVARLLDCEPGSAQADRPGDPDASVVVAAGARWTWREVRSRCWRNGVAVADVRPELARWMDDGMFCRWLDDAHLNAAPLVDAAYDALEPEGHAALERLLMAATGPATRRSG